MIDTLKRLILAVIFICTLILSVASVAHALGTGNYLSLLPNTLMLLAAAIGWLAPKSEVADFLSLNLSPVPKHGERKSTYSFKVAGYCFRCIVYITFVYSLAYQYELNIEASSQLFAIFVFALPIFWGMALLAGAYYILVFGYIKLSGNDAVYYSKT